MYKCNLEILGTRIPDYILKMSHTNSFLAIMKTPSANWMNSMNSNENSIGFKIGRLTLEIY